MSDSLSEDGLAGLSLLSGAFCSVRRLFSPETMSTTVLEAVSAAVDVEDDVLGGMLVDKSAKAG